MLPRYGNACVLNLPLIKSSNVSFIKGQCCVYILSTPLNPLNNFLVILATASLSNKLLCLVLTPLYSSILYTSWKHVGFVNYIYIFFSKTHQLYINTLIYLSETFLFLSNSTKPFISLLACFS